jgi:hypothetical protein
MRPKPKRAPAPIASAKRAIVDVSDEMEALVTAGVGAVVAAGAAALGRAAAAAFEVRPVLSHLV